MTWNIKSTDTILLNDIKNFEGTIQAQTRLGYFKNGKFWIYKDSRSLNTIGYGHLVTTGDNFFNGLTESQAETLLAKDLLGSFKDATDIYSQYKLDLPDDAQRVLVEMVFQMGKSKVLQFKNFLTDLTNHQYTQAANEMRSSLWYKQSTNRAEILAKRIQVLA